MPAPSCAASWQRNASRPRSPADDGKERQLGCSDVLSRYSRIASSGHRSTRDRNSSCTGHARCPWTSSCSRGRGRAQPAWAESTPRPSPAVPCSRQQTSRYGDAPERPRRRIQRERAASQTCIVGPDALRARHARGPRRRQQLRRGSAACLPRSPRGTKHTSDSLTTQPVVSCRPATETRRTPPRCARAGDATLRLAGGALCRGEAAVRELFVHLLRVLLAGQEKRRNRSPSSSSRSGGRSSSSSRQAPFFLPPTTHQ